MKDDNTLIKLEYESKRTVQDKLNTVLLHYL